MAINQRLRLERLLELVGERDASDLHFVVGKPPVIRVDRQLSPVEGEEPLVTDDTQALADVLLDKERREQLERRRELDFSYDFANKSRFRVNAYYQLDKLSIAMRLIPSQIKTLEGLGLPPVIKNFAKMFQGLVLAVGPSGHGKSTTLAALIDMINHDRSEHIVTIEDPVEYLFAPDKSVIDQRELGSDTRSFANALRSILREDADVVMVGEMRDLDTIASTITVAETGHLVFTTLHTNDAAQTIDRIIDVFPPHQQSQVRSQLSNIISGVVSQRLLPKVGGGRIVVTEVMTATPAIRNLIREGKVYQINSVIQTSAEEGMISLDKSLAGLVQEGQITMGNALRHAINKDNLVSMLKH